MMHACNPNTYKVEAEGSGVQCLRPGWDTRATVSQTSKQTNKHQKQIPCPVIEKLCWKLTLKVIAP